MSITLKYWNGRGLMEVPRMLLVIAGKFPGSDFTDGRFDAPPEGLTANLGRMPTMDVGSTTIGQSSAISFYLAAENGLMGKNNLEAAQIIAITEHIKEMRTEFSKLVPWGTVPTEEALADWFTGGATDVSGTADRAGSGKRFALWWMGRIEAVMGDAGFAVGDKISLADVLIYNTFGEYIKDEDAGNLPEHRRQPFGSKAQTDALLAKFPKLAASVAAVANNSNIQKYLSTRGPQGF